MLPYSVIDGQFQRIANPINSGCVNYPETLSEDKSVMALNEIIGF